MDELDFSADIRGCVKCGGPVGFLNRCPHCLTWQISCVDC